MQEWSTRFDPGILYYRCRFRHDADRPRMVADLAGGATTLFEKKQEAIEMVETVPEVLCRPRGETMPQVPLEQG